jgi:hypothetical protein
MRALSRSRNRMRAAPVLPAGAITLGRDPCAHLAGSPQKARTALTPHPPPAKGGRRLTGRLKAWRGRSGATNGGDADLRRCLRRGPGAW